MRSVPFFHADLRNSGPSGRVYICCAAKKFVWEELLFLEPSPLSIILGWGERIVAGRSILPDFSVSLPEYLRRIFYFGELFIKMKIPTDTITWDHARRHHGTGAV